MDKKIILRTKKEKPVEYIIRDFQNVEKIECCVMNGNEILKIYYNNNGFVEINAKNKIELPQICSGIVVIPLDKIDYFNTIKNPYEMLDNFWKIDNNLDNIM